MVYFSRHPDSYREQSKGFSSMCLVCIKKPIQARKGGIAQRWFLAKAQSFLYFI